MGFNDFLHRCEMLDFDFDPKLVSQGRMHTRDMHKLKVRLSSVSIAASKTGSTTLDFLQVVKTGSKLNRPPFIGLRRGTSMRLALCPSWTSAPGR